MYVKYSVYASGQQSLCEHCVEWIDGGIKWAGEWVDGWMDGRIDGWVDGRGSIEQSP